MLNPEKFGHYIALLCHINFAALALIIFVFERVRGYLESEKKRMLMGSEYSSFWKDKDFSSYKPKGPYDSLMFSFRWCVYSVTRILSIRVIDRKNYFASISKERFLIKFLPLFFYSGLYCLVLLIIAGCDAQFQSSHHLCKVVLLASLLGSYIYFILYFAFNRFSKSWFGMMFLNSLKIILTIFLSYLFVTNLNVTWLHSSFLINHAVLINTLIIIITLFPIIYLFLSVFVYFFPVWLMSKYSSSFNVIADDDLEKRGL